MVMSGRLHLTAAQVAESGEEKVRFHSKLHKYLCLFRGTRISVNSPLRHPGIEEVDGRGSGAG